MSASSTTAPGHHDETQRAQLVTGGADFSTVTDSVAQIVERPRPTIGWLVARSARRLNTICRCGLERAGWLEPIRRGWRNRLAGRRRPHNVRGATS